MRRILLGLSLTFAAIAGSGATTFGCGPLSALPSSGDAGMTGASSSGLPCGVDAVLANNCRGCHAAEPQFGAPMPLLTYADLTGPAKSDANKRVFERVFARTHDGSNPMPPPPNARLSEADQATLDAWIQSGAKPAAESCGSTVPTPTPGLSRVLTCTPDQHVRPPTKFVMPKNKSDEIVCYGFDVTNAQKRHVVAMGPRLDNTKILHHMILFESETAMSATPAPCSQGVSNWRFVAGWAPGGGAYELPPEAGFAQEGTTHYVMQVHYNNQAGYDGEADESGFDLCTTTDLRPNDADVMASGTLGIDLPPRAATDTSCDFKWPAGKVHVFGASPHMHRLGRSLHITRLKGEAPSTILDRPNFSFDIGGGGDPVNLDLENGDVVRTACGWKNTSDSRVEYGERTSDEMCFGFMLYYPRIVSPLWKFAVPAALGTCKTTNAAL